MRSKRSKPILTHKKTEPENEDDVNAVNDVKDTNEVNDVNQSEIQKAAEILMNLSRDTKNSWRLLNPLPFRSMDSFIAQLRRGGFTQSEIEVHFPCCRSKHRTGIEHARKRLTFLMEQDNELSQRLYLLFLDR